MAPTKLKSIPIDWFQRNLFALLPRAMIESNETLRSVQDYITKLEGTPTTLPASSLSFNDVLAIFGLNKPKYGMPWVLENHELYDPPAALCNIQSEIEFVLEGSPENEAFVRCTLNNILVSCIAEEKRRAMGQWASSATVSTDPLRPTTPLSEPASLTLRFETELKFPVSYKNESRILSGVADYTLWYDRYESMGTNLVVVEAKKRWSTGLANAQLIAYMGVMHRTRLQEGKQNAVVYGISTDGEEFRFWRIDNDSMVTHSKLYEWHLGCQSEIVSFIRYILRAAIASSPTKSPIKDKTVREATLAAFKDPGKQELFDYGLGNMSLEEMDEDNMEVLDPPDIFPHGYKLSS